MPTRVVATRANSTAHDQGTLRQSSPLPSQLRIPLLQRLRPNAAVCIVPMRPSASAHRSGRKRSDHGKLATVIKPRGIATKPRRAGSQQTTPIDPSTLTAVSCNQVSATPSDGTRAPRPSAGRRRNLDLVREALDLALRRRESVCVRRARRRW